MHKSEPRTKAYAQNSLMPNLSPIPFHYEVME